MSDILKRYEDLDDMSCYYESSMRTNAPLEEWVADAAAEITRLRTELAEVRAESEQRRINPDKPEPFEWYRCHECGETSHRDEYQRSELPVLCGGEHVQVVVEKAPVRVCVKCGSATVDSGYDNAIDKALRRALVAERDCLRAELAVARDGLENFASGDNECISRGDFEERAQGYLAKLAAGKAGEVKA